jgi:preprotein translocase subunit SecG
MQILNILHVLIAVAMIALVLVQRGTGATAGAAFGSGASGTVFGARGAGNFLTRSTWILATLFCAISLTMAIVVSRTSTTPTADLGVVSTAPAASPQAEDVPAGGDAPPAAEAVQSDVPPPPASEPGESGAGPTAEDLPAFDTAGANPGGTEEKSGGSPVPADDS